MNRLCNPQSGSYAKRKQSTMRSKFWNAMLRRRNTHLRPWLYFVADVQDARLKKGRCLVRGE